jgi:uncharacterized protein
MQATIAQLWTYPIKSCKGYRLTSAQALPTGLLHDRSMMVVSADGGKMVSQRGFPAMALIAPAINGDALTLNAPGIAPITLHLLSHAGSKTVTVWRDTLDAIDLGNEVADWLSAYLKISVRLVRFDPAQQRMTKVPLSGFPNAKHYFADGYPYLVLSLASLNALNERLLEKGSHAIPADRFRANILLDNVDAHTEDYAAALVHSNGAKITIHSACTRCTVPTIDQSTAHASPDQEPSLTLSAYRYDAQQDGVIFGMNALISVACTLTVGDALAVELAF